MHQWSFADSDGDTKEDKRNAFQVSSNILWIFKTFVYFWNEDEMLNIAHSMIIFSNIYVNNCLFNASQALLQDARKKQAKQSEGGMEITFDVGKTGLWLFWNWFLMY